MLIFIKGRHCKPPELIKNTVQLKKAASIYFSQNRLYGYQTPMLGKASGYKQRLLAEKFVFSSFLASNRNTSGISHALLLPKIELSKRTPREQK